MPDFSSTHSTTACSGGWWYRPTTSTTFSTKNGSVDSLNVPVKCGLRSNLRQIRPIVDFDSPLRCAIEARDQCVASSGISSSVAVMTSSTLSSRIDGGRPGRGSSCRPSRRRAMNRARHRSTVDSSTPRSAATCLFVPPSALRSTIFARSARYWAVFARRAHRSASPPAPPPSGPAQASAGRPARHPAARPAAAPRTDAATWTPTSAPPPAPARRPHSTSPRHRPDRSGPGHAPPSRQPRPAHQFSPLIFRQHDLHSTWTRHSPRLAKVSLKISGAAY